MLFIFVNTQIISMMHHIYWNENICEVLCSFFDYTYAFPQNVVGKRVAKCFEKRVSMKVLVKFGI